MDKDFLSLLADTVTFESPTGKNAQGKPTYVGATVRTYRCRIAGPVQDLRRPESGANSPLYTIWLDAHGDYISPQDRCTVPNSPVWGPDRTPLIFSVNVVTDENGYHHTKVTLGFMYHRQGQT